MEFPEEPGPAAEEPGPSRMAQPSAVPAWNQDVLEPGVVYTHPEMTRLTAGDDQTTPGDDMISGRVNWISSHPKDHVFAESTSTHVKSVLRPGRTFDNFKAHKNILTTPRFR